MSVQTDILADFLLARIAEDDEAARLASDECARLDRDFDVDDPGNWRRWSLPGASVTRTGPVARFIDAQTPERVLAKCVADRRIVEDHARVQWDDGELGCAVCGIDILPPADGVQVREAAGWPCPTLRWLALPYTDHDDYRPEWRP